MKLKSNRCYDIVIIHDTGKEESVFTLTKDETKQLIGNAGWWKEMGIFLSADGRTGYKITEIR